MWTVNSLSLRLGWFDSITPHQIAGLAQLVERLPCKQDVSGSIPLTGTNTTGKSIGRIGDTDPQARKSIESDQCSYRCEEVQLFEATRR